MTHLLSFDVEDWFHAHNMAPAIDRSEWEECESRVKDATYRILDILGRYDTKATFFVLGWVAERHPELVREIDGRGHEVASHGYNHRILYEQTPEEVRADLERSLEILEPLTEEPIRGYRAPSFSITGWATELLAETDFEYDSSSFSVAKHDRYGDLDMADIEATDEPIIRLPNGVTEIRLPTLQTPVGDVPWAGGGWFRFIPYRVFRWGIRRISDNGPFVFYLHPWEIDPDQPRQRDIPATYRLRHYTNLDATFDRLTRLLEDFEWQPIASQV